MRGCKRFVIASRRFTLTSRARLYKHAANAEDAEREADRLAVIGCADAREAESAARLVLGPAHYEWVAWATASMVLADQGEGDLELLLRAYEVREGLLVRWRQRTRTYLSDFGTRSLSALRRRRRRS